MAAASWLKYAYLAHFSKPRTERQLYRLVKVHKVCRIVEVGIYSLERTAAMIAVAQRYAGTEQVAYTGLDWFDARNEDLPKLTLKQAHRELQSTGATVRLVPGDPARSVAAIANAHQHTGLLLLSSPVPDSMLAPAWFYFPRMIDAELGGAPRADRRGRPADVRTAEPLATCEASGDPGRAESGLVWRHPRRVPLPDCAPAA